MYGSGCDNWSSICSTEELQQLTAQPNILWFHIICDMIYEKDSEGQKAKNLLSYWFEANIFGFALNGCNNICNQY